MTNTTTETTMADHPTMKLTLRMHFRAERNEVGSLEMLAGALKSVSVTADQKMWAMIICSQAKLAAERCPNACAGLIRALARYPHTF